MRRQLLRLIACSTMICHNSEPWPLAARYLLIFKASKPRIWDTSHGTRINRVVRRNRILRIFLKNRDYYITYSHVNRNSEKVIACIRQNLFYFLFFWSVFDTITLFKPSEIKNITIRKFLNAMSTNTVRRLSILLSYNTLFSALYLLNPYIVCEIINFPLLLFRIDIFYFN